MKQYVIRVAAVVLALGLSLTTTACPANKGPAQKAGRSIDNALGTNK